MMLGNMETLHYNITTFHLFYKHSCTAKVKRVMNIERHMYTDKDEAEKIILFIIHTCMIPRAQSASWVWLMDCAVMMHRDS
jgi:hypothetical protein